jgi:hypothetical protein
MAITKFVPEVWSATLLSVLEESLVYASAPVVNRNYEGAIANAGDTVHIVSIADPTISDYAKDTDLTIEVLTDEEQTLVIDQSKSFAFEVDDIDKRQAMNGGALMTEAARRAGFGLRDVADTFAAAKMIAGAGTALGVIDASSTATNVYDDVLVPAWVALEENNVPTEGRWIVLPPAVYGKLLLDSRFIKANESGTAALHNGMVGNAAGFQILSSNNAPDPDRTGIHATTTSGNKDIVGAAGTFTQADVGLTIAGTGVGSTNHIVSVSEDGTTATTAVNGTASAAQTDIAISGGGKAVIAGSQIATSYAEQINKVEAFRPEKRFADALKGLHLYGAKVVRPEALVVASVKTS